MSISLSAKNNGLGLSIVDSIVKLMKGTVSVESEKGKGSIFTVKLPMERADSPQNVTDCWYRDCIQLQDHSH